jgi:hypothetical protein
LRPVASAESATILAMGIVPGTIANDSATPFGIMPRQRTFADIGCFYYGTNTARNNQRKTEKQI